MRRPMGRPSSKRTASVRLAGSAVERRYGDLASWAMGRGRFVQSYDSGSGPCQSRPGKPKVVIFEEGSLAAEFLSATITTTKA